MPRTLKASRNGKRPLTARQIAVMREIEAFVAKHGFAPTEAEMAERFDVSPQAMHSHFLYLEQKGQISLEPGKKRSLRVLKTPPARAAKASNAVPDPPPARASRG